MKKINKFLCWLFGHPKWDEYITGGGGLDHYVPAGKRCVRCGKEILYEKKILNTIKMKVIYDPQQPLIDFLKANAAIVDIVGKPCYYLPFVFIEEPDGLNAVHLNSVPKEIFDLLLPKKDKE